MRQEITGIACDVRGCSEKFVFTPVASKMSWHHHIIDLAEAVEQGWAIVAHPRLRSYCPAHAMRVYSCTCKTHPTRKHLCTFCEPSAAAQIWTTQTIPSEVNIHLVKGI